MCSSVLILVERTVRVLVWCLSEMDLKIQSKVQVIYLGREESSGRRRGK